MNRQEINRKIIKLLGDNPTKEMLKIVDFYGDLDDFIENKDIINKNIETCTPYRFIQLLWAMGINLHGHGEGDRFYEESEETLNKLQKCMTV